MKLRPWALVLVAACGGTAERPPVVAIPDQPGFDAGPPSPSPAVTDAGSPAVVAAPPLSPGANGPRDAKSIVGEIGETAAGISPVLLVNTGEMRAHPLGPALGALVVRGMIGWNQFLPIDLIDPVKDTDWVVMAGDIHLGSTSANVILARYNVTETRADVVWRDLEKRLPGKPLDTKVAGTKALSATVDRAPRAYVRGKPGTLAIVPAAVATTVARQVAQVGIPRSVRKNELLRFAAAKRSAIRMFEIPHDIRSFRIWIDAEGPRLFLNAEGDCDDAEAASRAAGDLRASLDEQAARIPLGGMIARALLGGASVWSDGSTARYRGEIEERVLAFASAFANP